MQRPVGKCVDGSTLVDGRGRGRSERFMHGFARAPHGDKLTNVMTDASSQRNWFLILDDRPVYDKSFACAKMAAVRV